MDKIKFAKLISYIGYLIQPTVVTSDDWIEEIDRLITFEPAKVNFTDVDELMALMSQGTRKIEAIKVYRVLTGVGLLESKNAVEKYWKSKPINTKA